MGRHSQNFQAAGSFQVGKLSNLGCSVEGTAVKQEEWCQKTLFLSLSHSLRLTHTFVHTGHVQQLISFHQTFPPKSTQAVLAVSLEIISHTIQHVLTAHSLLPHQHAAQQYANTTSFSRPLHMSTQLSLQGIENDLNSV